LKSEENSEAKIINISISFTAENHPVLNHPHKKTLLYFTENLEIQAV